jgi:hypothetical protein
MKHVHASVQGWRASFQLGILLGAMAFSGCDSGETVLKMPEGGPPHQPSAEEIERSGPPANSKARKGITSRREHEKALQEEGSK